MHVPPYFFYLTRINQKGAESLFPRRGCKKPKHLMHKLTQYNQCKIPAKQQHKIIHDKAQCFNLMGLIRCMTTKTNHIKAKFLKEHSNPNPKSGLSNSNQYNKSMSFYFTTSSYANFRIKQHQFKIVEKSTKKTQYVSF